MVFALPASATRARESTESAIRPFIVDLLWAGGVVDEHAATQGGLLAVFGQNPSVRATHENSSGSRQLQGTAAPSNTAVVSGRTSRQPGKYGRYVDTYERR